MLTPSLCAIFGCRRKPTSNGLCKVHALESSLRTETTAQKKHKKKLARWKRR